MDLSLLDGGRKGIGLVHAFLVELDDVVGQLIADRGSSKLRNTALASCTHVVNYKILLPPVLNNRYQALLHGMIILFILDNIVYFILMKYKHSDLKY